MDISTWLAYLVVTLICVLTPGASVLFAISNSLTLGWRRITFFSVGNILGFFFVALFSIAGLGVLLKTSILLFFILKIIGGSYLIYLGYKQWNSKVNIFSNINRKTEKKELQKTDMQLFLKGLLLAITNPNVILFFSALFPQFIKPERNLLPQFIILIGTFMFCSFFASLGYAYAATSAKVWFSKDNKVDWFNRAAGSIFILLGVNVLRTKNKL